MMNFGYTVKELLTVAKAGDITHLCVGEMSAIENEKNIMLAVTEEDSIITECINITNSVDFKSRLTEYRLVEGMFKDDVEVDDACLMIYTSGSTGVPKGVLLSAYNILSTAEAMANVVHICHEDRFCLVLPIFHIFGFTGGLFSVIVGGGQIHIAKSTRSADVISTLKDKKCTLIYSVPSLILAIINNPEFKTEDFSALRSIMVGGAPTTESQAKNMKKALPGVRFINAFGLSEMTPGSLTSYDEDYEDFHKMAGKPIDIINVKVIDTATGEECKKGQTGEIYVDGTNLMTCYYKQDISSQAIDENGWLRTGDLGYFDDKGRLCIAGRIKEIIIRGGENIMPDEIASAISEYEDVADVKVVGVPHNFFGEAACAVVVMKNGKSLDEEKIKSFLAKRISKQKIPDYFFI